MKLQDAVKPFVVGIVGSKLLKNQAEALGIFVAAALTLSRSILTDLAVEITRQGFARTVKSALKRLDRWINNPRISVSVAMQPLVERLVAKRRKKLVVALDWVDIRGFKTLVAAATIKGRAVWLMWTSVPKSGLNLNTNRLEEYVLMELRRMLPERFTTIILADRGFHKTRLFTVCRKLRFAYVVRLKADYHVQTRRYAGLLSQGPLARGCARFWENVICGKKPRFRQNIVIYWAKKLPEDRDGPWFLATSAGS